MGLLFEKMFAAEAPKHAAILRTFDVVCAHPAVDLEQEVRYMLEHAS